MRLELAQLRAGEDRVIDTVLVETPRVGDRPAQAFLGPQASDPALVLHEGACRLAGLGDQRVMLRDTVRHQRGQGPRRLLDAVGCRVVPIAIKPGCDAWPLPPVTD